MYRTTLLLALPVWLALTTTTHATVHDHTLANGLRVIVAEDRRSPVVAVKLFYKLGSHQEYPGLSGISHALEHMAFEGSSKLAANEYSQVLDRLGAVENAATGYDSTTYYQTLPSEHLEVALEIGADVMGSASLSPEAFVRVMEAVKAEHAQRIGADPQGRLMAALGALVFPTSGYRTHPGGSLLDLQRLTLDNVKQWYTSWYAPNNAVLVVVGDVQAEQVNALAQRHFGLLERRTLPTARMPLELDAPGERRIALDAVHVQPSLYLAFNWPSYATTADHRTIAALNLLPYLLTEGLGAQLTSTLVRGEEQLANLRSEYLPLRRGASLFLIGAELVQGTTHDIALEKIWEQLQGLKNRAPTPEALERARTLFIAEQIYGRDDQQARAEQLGELAIAELPLTLPALQLAHINSLTPEDLRQAASLWLTRDRASVAYLHNKDVPHE